MPAPVPEVLAAWMRPFRGYFTTAVWRHALVLVAGALLAPGRRTVTAALRVMGLEQAPGFAVHHRVLSYARWSSRAVGHRLLLLLVAAFVPTGPVVVGIDDTIERRWGAKIKARGIYRDPVRSSRGHFVKASGLRWICVRGREVGLGRVRDGGAGEGRIVRGRCSYAASRRVLAS